MNRRTTIFMLFTMAYFMSYFYRSANAIIAPDLASEMTISAAQLGLMTSLFFAAFALVQLPLGMGLDQWGPRYVTPGFLLMGVAGSLVFAAAPTFPVLAMGRALIGVGMAAALMGSLKIFSQWFSPGRFATLSGLLVGIGSLGAVGAATPLAWLNSTIGWRSVFWIGAVVTFVVALGIAVWARNSPPGVAWSSSVDNPGQLGDVFKDKRFWRMAPLNFFLAGTMLAFQGLWAGPYLFDVLRLTAIEAGNVLLALGMSATIGYTVSGWLSDRYGLSRIIVACAAVFVLCQFALVARPPFTYILIVYIVLGFTGAFNIMLLAQTRQVFPLHMVGKAATAVNVFGMGGTFILQWAMGSIIGLWSLDATGHYPSQAHAAALLFTALGTLIALFWYLPLAQRPSSQG